MKFLRPRLAKYKLRDPSQRSRTPNSRLFCTAGIVSLGRQQDTANGIILALQEDQLGATQVIVWRDVREAQREGPLGSRLLAVEGLWQRQGIVCNLNTERLAYLLSPLPGRLRTRSRNFR